MRDQRLIAGLMFFVVCYTNILADPTWVKVRNSQETPPDSEDIS